MLILAYCSIFKFSTCSGQQIAAVSTCSSIATEAARAEWAKARSALQARLLLMLPTGEQ
jgi:hypothetical protein